MAPGVAAAPAGPATGGGGGSIPAIARGKSARTVLKLTWEYPSYKAPEQKVDAGQTVAPKARQALPRVDALAYIAGQDRRPLLVLRECKRCNGTDDALLSRGVVDNEKTFLLARWFHCVKLPVDVMEKDHPFHNLFADENPEHMFMCSADGSLRLSLESERSRTELWGAMTEILKATYAAQPDGVLRKMEKTIDAFDLVDQKVTSIERRIDELLETEGADAKKLKKTREELSAAQAERDQLFRALDQATVELKLKKIAESEGETSPKRS